MMTSPETFVFEGVTTTTGAVGIGKVPIREGESAFIEAVIVGREHDAAATERAFYKLYYTVYRDYNGNVTQHAAVVVELTQETTAGLDGTLAVDTTAQTVDVDVTGLAATNIKWVAVLTVTRNKLG